MPPRFAHREPEAAHRLVGRAVRGLEADLFVARAAAHDLRALAATRVAIAILDPVARRAEPVAQDPGGHAGRRADEVDAALIAVRAALAAARHPIRTAAIGTTASTFTAQAADAGLTRGTAAHVIAAKPRAAVIGILVAPGEDAEDHQQGALHDDNATPSR